MRPRGPQAVIGATIVLFSSLVTGGAVATSRASDEAALRPTRTAADLGIEARVSNLLGQMTVDEKLQQL